MAMIKFALLPVAAVFLITGCSSGTTSGSPDTGAGTSNSPTVSTFSPSFDSPAAANTDSSPPATRLPNLTNRVLRLNDLPAGWAIDHSKSTGGVTGCASVNGLSDKSAEKRQAAFAYDGNLPTLQEAVGYFPNGTSADFAAGVKTLDGCHHFTIRDDGSNYGVELGRTSFPTVGDATAAYTATTTIQRLSVSINIVVFRRGNYVAFIVYGDIGSTDIADVEKLAKRANTKLGS